MYEALLGTIFASTVAIGLIIAGILVILIWKKDRTRKLSYLRLYIQIVSLVALFYSFTLALWLSVFLLAIFVATLFSGRFFCGWICPFGFYMDIVSMIRKKLGIRYWTLPDRVNSILNKLRYVIAAVILISPLLLGALTITPASEVQLLFLRGPYRSLNILLSPLEPLIVPWTGGLADLGVIDWSFSYPYARDIMAYIDIPIVTSIIIYTFIALTLVSTFMFRRFWCRFCPTGISLAAANKFKAFSWAPLLHINKTEEKCTKCGICKRVCPVQVTDVYEQKGGDIRTSVCLNCMRCVEMCPYEDCLKVNLGGKTLLRSRNWLEPSNIE
ncbi:MAG: 4Fe-4S binding protein [Candidatus Bathyarchaeota archaeon]|nr:4Fe-4S binding protein [Candidatus Bathyarchaeota archaeon]